MAATDEQAPWPARAVGVAVLAGGEARRMGGQKATAPLLGEPLIGYPLAAARSAGLRAMVVAKRNTALPSLRERVVLEPDEPHHPLCGLVAALGELAQGGRLIALGCDMPFVTAPLLAHMAGAPGTTLLAAPAGGPEPLLARYCAEDLPVLEDALSAQAPLRETIDRLHPTFLHDAELARFGDPALLCASVNDAITLRWAAGELARRRAAQPGAGG